MHSSVNLVIRRCWKQEVSGFFRRAADCAYILFSVQIKFALCSRCCRRLLFSFAAISSQVRSSLSHSRFILITSPLPFSPRCRRGSLILPRDLSWKEEGCEAPPPKSSPPLHDRGAQSNLVTFTVAENLNFMTLNSRFVI